MNKQEMLAWIDRYLNNELQGEQLREIEEKMRTDDSFREEVELQRRLILKIRENALRASLVRLESELSLDEAPPLPVPRPESRPTGPGTGPGETPSRHPGGERQTGGGPALSSSARRTYYAVAAAIALLVAAGVTAYFTRTRDAAVFPSPELLTLSYEGDADPPFPAMGVKGDTPPQYVPVLIYPPTGAYTHHYQFADTLRLYGNFNPGRLTVSYRRDGERYELRTDAARYPLRRSTSIEPLAAAP